MPNKFNAYRSRITQIKKTIEQTKKGHRVLDALKKHKLKLLDILHDPNVPEKEKQRIVAQLKLENELK
jgi:PleD family two-component response regulator